MKRLMTPGGDVVTVVFFCSHPSFWKDTYLFCNLLIMQVVERSSDEELCD